MHTQLWRVFSESPESGCRMLSAIAVRLKRLRERADYDAIFHRVDDEIPNTLADARKFADLLAALAPRYPDPNAMRQ